LTRSFDGAKMGIQFSERDRKLGCDGIMAKELEGVSADQTHDGGGETLNVRSTEGAVGITEAENVLAENPDSDLSGTMLGNYKLIRRLGVGGMGSVYLAQHTLLGRNAAIKVMPQETERKSSALERFRLESRAIASLNHPNIVRAHDFSADGAIHYLVMEYVEGTNLDKLILDNGPLAEEVAADFMRQASDGLAEVHRSGLIHRDVKPANLLLETTGVIKLLDLGVVRYCGSDSIASLTLEYKEHLLGTVDYLAPEQGLDSHAVDARTDIYSLGCTFYYLLMGRPPFSDGTLAQRMLMHQLHDAPRIEDFRKGISPAIASLVRKMLAKRPSERVQSAAEVSQILSNWLAERNQDKEAARTGTSLSRPSQIIMPAAQPPAPLSPPPNSGSSHSGSSRGSSHSRASRETLSGRSDDTVDWSKRRHEEPEEDSSDYQPAFERKSTRRQIGTGYFTIRRLAAAVIFAIVVANGILLFQGTGELPSDIVPVPAPTNDLVTETHPNGTKSAQGRMSNGGRQGPWILFNDMGEKVGEGEFVNNQEQGPWVYWVKNGQQESSGSYRAGKRHGPWKFRYDDGQQKKAGRYQEGVEDGTWTFWHPNGQKSAEGEFKLGQKVEGTWREWDAAGNLKK